MDNICQSRDMTAWLIDQTLNPHSPMSRFLNYVKQHRDNLARQALQEGNTDYIKGGVSQLDYIQELVNRILTYGTDTDTGTAQADTETETV